MLLDLSGNGVSGAQAERSLDLAGITLNKNVIPYETLGPKKTSGMRIGTPAVTTRGMKEEEMRYIARLIVKVLERLDDNAFLEKTRKEVEEFCSNYSIYPELGQVEPAYRISGFERTRFESTHGGPRRG